MFVKQAIECPAVSFVNIRGSISRICTKIRRSKVSKQNLMVYSAEVAEFDPGSVCLSHVSSGTNGGRYAAVICKPITCIHKQIKKMSMQVGGEINMTPIQEQN